MSATTVFVRTLLKASAIFLGTTLVLVNPSFEWEAPRGTVTAQKSPAKAAVDGLIAVLRDPNAAVRREAALALGRIGDASALPPLSSALDDDSALVRGAAAHAIAEIKAGLRQPALWPALKDADPGVRREAARAIGVVGR